ncbi:hypothetical protein EDD85DRAFT_946149 [Armillaria nabsnona]|nr:hypothetical protein EDD85DRAFT_946149 [Armillaria nabsnona]
MSIREVSEDKMDSVVGGQCKGTGSTLIVALSYMVANSDEAYSDMEEARIPSNGFINNKAVESDGDDIILTDSEKPLMVDWSDSYASDVEGGDAEAVLPGGLCVNDKDSSNDGRLYSDLDDDGAMGAAPMHALTPLKQSSCSSVKTEKGLYVESFISARQGDDIASKDDNLFDPTVPCDPPKEDAAPPETQCDIYLNDLYPEPLLHTLPPSSHPAGNSC